MTALALAPVSLPAPRWDKGLLDSTSPATITQTASADHATVTSVVPAGTVLMRSEYGQSLGSWQSASVDAPTGSPVDIDLTFTVTIPPGLLDPATALDFRLGVFIQTLGAEVTLDPVAGMTFAPVGAVKPGETYLAAMSPRANAKSFDPAAGTHTITLHAKGIVSAGRTSYSVAAGAAMYHGASGQTTAYPAPSGGGTIVAVVAVDAAAPPAAGPVLHFRDPADGKFKPLTEVRVRGVVDSAPDLSMAGIVWGTHDLLEFDWANAAVVQSAVPLAGLRVTPLADGVRVQADAWHFAGGSAPVARVQIPIKSYAALAALPKDDRIIRPQAVTNPGGSIGGALPPSVVITNDTLLNAPMFTVALPVPAGGPSFGLPLVTDPLLTFLSSPNPKLNINLGYVLFAAADLGVMDFTFHSFRVLAQEVVAP